MVEAVAEKLLTDFDVTYLKITDDSRHHHGHYHEKRRGTHLTVELVSPDFSNVLPLKRHRLVYKALDDFLKNGVHALKLDLKS